LEATASARFFQRKDWGSGLECDRSQDHEQEDSEEVERADQRTRCDVQTELPANARAGKWTYVDKAARRGWGNERLD
jgi:hypothetical protein